MCKILVIMVLLLSVSVATDMVTDAEKVTFDNNWADRSLFTVVSETPVGVEIVFSMHEMVVEEMEIGGMPMKNFGVPGMLLPNDEGAPNLTGTGRYIAIPHGAQTRVTIMSARTEVYHNVEVAPAPNIPLDIDDSPLRYEKDMSIYGRNAFYPEIPVKLSEPTKIRGVDVVILGITPFQYNPVIKELIVYKDIRVRVDFLGGNGHFGEDRLRSRFWELILQGHLLNYNSLPKIDFYAPERIRARDGWEYIIIVPDDAVFEAWGDTIKAWRKLQGISCEVFTLTEVGGSSSAAIENFLNNAYTTWDPAPVAFLILSDHPSSGENYGVPAAMWGNVASDNIYADINGNNLPDIHHARICAQDESDLSTMINKFLSYEREPYAASNFYDEPLVACGWQDDRWFQLCIEVVRGFFISALGKNPARQYNLGSPANPTPGGFWSYAANTYTVVNYFANLGYIPTTNPYDATWWNNGSASGVNAAINSGAFVVQHRDHGNETGWGEPNYSNSSIDNLTNEMFTYVYSINCLTGKYDWSGECFAEKFHRIEHGALGVNAASEVSHSFVNDTYVWGMYDCLWPDFMPGFPVYNPAPITGSTDLMPCMAMTSGKYFLQQSNWPYSGNKTLTYHLFHHHGDAFNPLYSEMPQNLAVFHAIKLLDNQTSFTVTANNSSVIALTIDGEIIGVAEGTGSAIAISIPQQTVGSIMKVTVTKANYYRYEADVPVAPNNYAYVIAATTIVDDSGGNSQINPGESISYGVYGLNIGAVTAQSIYALLSESDPFVNVIEDSSWFGAINEDDSVLSYPYYDFTVANDCPDGHVISFTLEFHDSSDSTWTSYPQETVYASVLTYQEHVVMSSYGILYPGQTADLVVTLMNEGTAIAEDVTSTLTTSSSYIIINDASGNFGTIDPGNTATNTSDPYNITADILTPYETPVDFSIIVEYGIYIDTLDFTLVVGQFVPTDTGYYYVYFPDGPPTQSPVFEWIAIDTTQTANPGVSLDLDRNQTVIVDLPFTFKYYGVDYNRISICSNGWIAMDSTASTVYANSAIPSTYGPPAMIAGLWDYLQPGTPDEPGDIYYYDDAANHRFIVEYFRVEHFPISGYYETFEIILYDPVYYPTPTGDGEIIVQYLLALQLPVSLTVGIEDSTQTVGVQYYFNGTYDSLAMPITDSFALKYTTYPPGVGIEEHKGLSTLPSRTMLCALYPNPFRRELVIKYQIADMDKASNACLKIYDAAGRLVKDFSRLTLDALRPTQIIWDGTDQNNRKVPAGVYFVRFVVNPVGEAGDYSKTEKAILLR